MKKYTIVKVNNKIRKLEREIAKLQELKQLLLDGKPPPTQALEKRQRYVYTIECENGCYYVGQTKNVPKRFKQHQAGKGSWFTTLNRPIKVIDTIDVGIITEPQAIEWENRIAAQLISIYGIDSVRGGAFIQRNQRHFINQLNRYAVDLPVY